MTPYERITPELLSRARNFLDLGQGRTVYGGPIYLSRMTITSDPFWGRHVETAQNLRKRKENTTPAWKKKREDEFQKPKDRRTFSMTDADRRKAHEKRKKKRK